MKILFFLLCLGLGGLHAQPQLRLRVAPPIGDSLRLATPTESVSFMAQDYRLLPAYARQNPRGYTYLCRLELEVEETLPVGLWFKMDEGPSRQTGMLGSAHLRLRFRLWE
ncbi:MAG: hypothetical protein D6722_05700 [Bacteroidetes bacterium]|nr:MAG: hypothetical protein D6722_05700 [Bacteroidota bacterium]